MVKKVRLIDDEVTTVAEDTESVEVPATSGSGTFSAEEKEQLMKYAEAIDWKLWEILKLLRTQTEDK
jgi:hypothetical protein